MTFQNIEHASKEPETTAKTSTCPCCGSRNTRLFYSVKDVPTNSCVLFDTREAALTCPRGDIDLTFCSDCGFMYNASFIAKLTEYSERYEETQGFSPTFSRFHTDLAKRLIDKHSLKQARVMEIGCGKGEFLLLLSQLGENTGIGIDPSAIPERLAGLNGAERVELIPEFFDVKYCTDAPDFLCCKMTLEHISDTHAFVDQIRQSLDATDETIIFFQIPESLRILRQCAFEDIYYEHCSYFTPGSLGRLFRSCGFDVSEIATEYDDQYLTIEARPGVGSEQHLDIENDLEETVQLVESFPDRIEAMKERWAKMAKDAHEQGKTVALWGSGSKAVSFLTSLGVNDAIQYVTDINPNRHNHFMPGTGQRIVAPEELKDISPDLVIVMNRIYKDEIAEDLASMGLSPEIECL